MMTPQTIDSRLPGAGRTPRQAMKPIDLAPKPTPITLIDGLRPGIRIHVKRDDMTGLLCSGNKVRKLEFLLADARARNANLVITCGPVQSNHVRATIAACNELGLKVAAVLRGEPQKVPDGNFLIDSLLGAEFRFITRAEYQRVDELMAQMAEEYRAQGLRPYIVPEGGSNGVGALGYAQAVEELVRYAAENHVEAVFCAVGSGGTYAGLLAGQRIYGLEAPIHGILVCDDIGFFRNKVSRILREVESILDRRLFDTGDEFHLDDRFIGAGAGQLYPEAIDTIREVARRGVILDPIYTSKAFHGMLVQAKEQGYRNPLFLHTGGLFGLFPYRSELAARVDAS